MAVEVLSTSNCYLADQLAVKSGIASIDLMENAGAGIARVIQQRRNRCPTWLVCGPGANGGDGFVIARHLSAAGWPVSIARIGRAKAKTDAGRMADLLPKEIVFTDQNIPSDTGLIIDCLFGAGLSKTISGDLAELVRKINADSAFVVSVDLPSGIEGDCPNPANTSIQADLTVSFEVLKPAHVLEPARNQCGEIKLIQIGFPGEILDQLPKIAIQNHPELWHHIPSAPNACSHKHNRGRLLVICGGPLQTGAARLAARAGLRIGAGWVTLAGGAQSMAVCGHHETSIVLAELTGSLGFAQFLQTQAPDCVLLGPAGGVGAKMRQDVLELLASGIPAVLDADALSSFSGDPKKLLNACQPHTVLTPHEGEFAALFPDLDQKFGTKIDRVKAAAIRAGCTILLKGSDSVIANEGGQVVVNNHTSNWLASLGTGDVLAGMVGGLIAQGNTGFAALCAAVWMHGELARNFGPGLIAEDLPAEIPKMLRQMLANR